MTPAAELHAAAAKLRERAEKIPPWARAEPWRVVQADSEKMNGVTIGVNGPWELIIEAYRESLADYIATVHPGVGLLLADLLDRTAAAAADKLRFLPEAFVSACFARELAVARAILGIDQRHSAQPGTDAAPSTSGTVAT